MTKQDDLNCELRAAVSMRELDKAKRAISPNAINVLLRVTLAILFMYLIVVSHQLFGMSGPAFVSALFIVAFFVPLAYQTLRRRSARRQAQLEKQNLSEEAEARQKA